MKHFIPGEEIHRGFLRGGEWVKYEEDTKDIKPLYDAAIAIAPNNQLFPPIPVLNIDFLLFLILNT